MPEPEVQCWKAASRHSAPNQKLHCRIKRVFLCINMRAMEVVGCAECEPVLTSPPTPTPQWFLHTNCVVVYPSAFAVKFKRHFMPSKITVVHFITSPTHIVAVLPQNFKLLLIDLFFFRFAINRKCHPYQSIVLWGRRDSELRKSLITNQSINT